MAILGWDYWKDYTKQMQIIRGDQQFLTEHLFPNLVTSEDPKGEPGKWNTLTDGSRFKWEAENQNHYVVRIKSPNEDGSQVEKCLLVDKRLHRISQAVHTIGTDSGESYRVFDFRLRHFERTDLLGFTLTELLLCDARHHDGVHETASYMDGKLKGLTLSVNLTDDTSICGSIAADGTIKEMWKRDAKGKIKFLTPDRHLSNSRDLYQYLARMKQQDELRTLGEQMLRTGWNCLQKGYIQLRLALLDWRSGNAARYAQSMRDGFKLWNEGLNALDTARQLKQSAGAELSAMAQSLEEYHKDLENVLREQKESPGGLDPGGEEQELSQAEREVEKNYSELRGKLKQPFSPKQAEQRNEEPKAKKSEEQALDIQNIGREPNDKPILTPPPVTMPIKNPFSNKHP